MHFDKEGFLSIFAIICILTNNSGWKRKYVESIELLDNNRMLIIAFISLYARKCIFYTKICYASPFLTIYLVMNATEKIIQEYMIFFETLSFSRLQQNFHLSKHEKHRSYHTKTCFKNIYVIQEYPEAALDRSLKSLGAKFHILNRTPKLLL